MQLYALLFLTHKDSLCTWDFLESDQLTRDCTLKKHSPYFPRSYQLHLRKEWDSIFRSLSMLVYYFVRASTGLVHAFQALWVHMWIWRAMLEKHCFFVVIDHFWLLISLHPIFYNDAWVIGYGVIHMSTQHFLILYTFARCEFLC